MHRRGRRAAGPKKRIVLIVSRTVAVKDEPSKFGDTLCQVSKGTYLLVTSSSQVEGVEWMQCPCGFVCSLDVNGFQCYEESSEVAANKQWAIEFDNRRRMTGAITATLSRTHSLPNGRRVARAIYNYVNRETPVHLVNLPDVSIEDLMIGLKSSQGLRQAEILEFLKIAASQQSNPPKTLKDMAQEVYDTMAMRPTRWIKDDLNVIETVDVTSKNDQFIMAAAHGNRKTFDKFLAMGQELAALHSELKYTALHAAADFGHIEIVKELISTGMSVNIRDARHGQTPLHFAGQSNRCDIARMLLDAGADRTIPNYRNILPYQLADQQGNFEAREILKHTPPAVQYITVVKCTTTTIHLRWDPPIVHEETHSRVNDYVVEWDPVGKVHEVGHGDRFYTSAHEYKIRRLRPSSGHGFKIYSRSSAGWSQPSSQLIQFTMPACPDAPPPVEMLRLATNAVYLAWHPPAHDNGAKLDLYQLELIDSEMGKEKDKVEKEDMARKKRLRQAKRRAQGGMRLKQVKSYSDGALEEKSLDEGDEEDDFDEAEGDEGVEEGSDEEKSEDMESDEEEYEDTEEEDSDMDGLGVNLENSTIASLKEGSVLGSISLAEESSLVPAGSVPEPPKSKAGGKSMMHRMYKHKRLKHREKLCMGLEPYRAYQARVRCHNELGYSAWSEWIGPIVPQPGVYVLEFNREERSARIGWFRPFLSNGRTVTHFEAQLARLDGPMESDIKIFAHEKTQTAQALNYRTLDSNLTTNELIVPDLKAGCKYRVRVRCEINNEWSPWQHAFVSDPINVPACAPEKPFHVRAAKKLEKDLSSLVLSDRDSLAAEAENSVLEGVGGMALDGAGSMVSSSTMGTAINPGSLDKADTMPMGTKTLGSVSEGLSEAEMQLNVTHNTIQLEWTNGNTNGSPAQEFVIEMAKVRDYSQADIEAAAEAAVDTTHGEYQEGESMIVAGSTLELEHKEKVGDELPKSASGDAGESELESGTNSDDDDDGDGNDGKDRASLDSPSDDPAVRKGSQGSLTATVIAGSSVVSTALLNNLKWQDISTTGGEMTGASSFRAENLIPGSTYLFRVKMRNEYGWSPMSSASKLIRTYPCTPTGKPFTTTVNSQFIHVQWNESSGQSTGLTSLSFELEIGKVPLGEGNNIYPHTINWEAAVVREMPSLCAKPMHGVMVDRLNPGSMYVVRVRVRTIAGWSAWSEISEIISTPK